MAWARPSHPARRRYSQASSGSLRCSPGPAAAELAHPLDAFNRHRRGKTGGNCTTGVARHPRRHPRPRLRCSAPPQGFGGRARAIAGWRQSSACDPERSFRLIVRTTAPRPMPPFHRCVVPVCNELVTCRSAVNRFERQLFAPHERELPAQSGHSRRGKKVRHPVSTKCSGERRRCKSVGTRLSRAYSDDAFRRTSEAISHSISYCACIAMALHSDTNASSTPCSFSTR
jgi:hypothetical protein